jgi:glycosyltransferase involved in cell wall biosynthesis/SAM-dependent methyltransferase
MRIAILTTQCPFVFGGAELHARGLERALREAGHEAEIISIPFKWYPSTTVLDHMLAARCLDVSEFTGVKIDLAIGLKFPAYLMRHPNKTFWILHQHRQAYDLWDAGDSNLFDDEHGQVVREAIRAADNTELGAAGVGGRRVFANSANVAARLRRYNSIEATPLYHPPPLAGRLSGGDFGDYFYYPSRISPPKRQDFVLRALAKAHGSVRVIFSGAPDNPDYGRELMRLAHDLGVEDRVEWRGFVSEGEMVDLYAGARGVLFTPVDEDLGYIALEAMLAGKPLLTLTDAGEPAALARHEVEGLITAPEPKAFAEAMDRLADSRDLASALGAAGLERYRALDVSWEHAVAALTGEDMTGADVAASPAPTPAETAVTPLVRERVRAVDWLAPTPDVLAADIISPDALAETYAFDDHLARHRDYYETHWPRYRATLDAITRSGVKPRRILELGSSAPYVFTALLRETFPEAEFTVIQESPPGLDWRHRIEGKNGEPIDVSVFGLNVETTPLPFADGAFDLVVAMEILEHLAIDPGFVFREARRVLREGGALLVTTPNLVSLPAVARALGGASPYSFGVFVPWNGVYGRHNREYTPLEVESLGRYAGLETALLDTADIYRQETVSDDLVRYMTERRHPLDLRGQNIFYLGRKSATALPAPFPETLFPIDPAIFSGEVRPRRGWPRQSGEADENFVVRIVNHSPLTWLATGPCRVRLTVDRVDQDGRVTADAQAFDLPHDLAPGGELEISIRAIKGEGVHGCWHEIGLYAEGAGPFKGAGRARVACVFAEALET